MRVKYIYPHIQVYLTSLIITTIIFNLINNNNDNDNNKVIIIKGRGGWEKTLQKLIKKPQPLSTVKLQPHVMTHT